MIKEADLTRVSLLRCTGKRGGLVLWKCLLTEVRIDGVFESLRIVPPDGNGYAATPPTQYAVDVSTARCGEVEILGIPPELVRYDPEYGGILGRKVLMHAERLLQQGSDYFGGIVAKFRAYGGERSVYVVPTEAPEAPLLLKELRDLKAQGLLA